MKKALLVIALALLSTPAWALPSPTPSPSPTPAGLPINGMTIQVVPNGAAAGTANHVVMPPFSKKK